MSEPVLQAVSQPEARRAVARSRAYATFARLFDYPDGELVEDVRDGTLAEAFLAHDAGRLVALAGAPSQER